MKNNVLTKSFFAALLLASTVVAAEEQYPAADFQPTVIYSEAGAEGSAATESAEATAAEAKSEKTAEKEESSNTLLFGVVILAVAGGFFLSKKPKAKAKTAASPAPSTVAPDASGLSGVERYLQAQNASAATGVEKYLAKKEVTDKEASLTGVDKYLRDRG